VVAGCNKKTVGSAQSRAANGWFNTACFVAPTTQFSFGNESRVDSTIRGGGAANFDLSANKFFKVAGPVTGKFSVEAFNLFNRTQFGAPDSGLGDPLFGHVSSQINKPRILQFAARFSF
jgi:hypothetical protein